MKVLETERLLIRHFELGDLEAIHREVYSDPEVCHFFCRNTRTLEHTERWLRYRSYQSEHEQWGLLAVVPKETGEVVGLCGLQPYAGLWLSLESTPEDLRKYAPLEVELTYAFGKAHWGKGYAYEACLAMIDYAFRDLRLRRLVTGADPANVRARKLQARLGMRRERNLKADSPDTETEGVLDNDRI